MKLWACQAVSDVNSDRFQEITVKIVTLPAKGWMAFRRKQACVQVEFLPHKTASAYECVSLSIYVQLSTTVQSWRVLW